MKSLLLTCVLVALTLLVQNHFAEISSSRNEIDELELALKDVKKMLLRDSMIVFSSPIQGPGIIYKTQFAMAPVIFKDAGVPGDKMLLIEKLDGIDGSTIDSTGILYTKVTGNLKFTLKVILK